jgi:hypothetical protein
MLNIYQTEDGAALEICDLNCSSTRKLLEVTGGDINGFIISDNGKKVVVKISSQTNDNSSITPGIYLIDVDSATKKTVSEIASSQIFDVSVDGKLVLYSRTNSSTGFNDLVLFNSEKNEARTLRENHDGFKYIFDRNDSNLIYFATKKDDKFEIDQLNVNKNEISKIIQIASDEELINLKIRSNYFFYTTTRGLFISSISTPKSFKFVTDKLNDFVGDSL